MAKLRDRRKLALLLAVIIVPVLACGPFGGTAKQPTKAVPPTEQAAPGGVATAKTGQATAVAKGETPRPAAKATETPASKATPEQSSLKNLLSNVAKLAPVHATSLYTMSEGDKLTEKMRVEVDIDAAGNRHILVFSGDQDTPQADIVQVGSDLFMRSGEGDQFVKLPMQGGDEDWGFLTMYGAPWLLFFNDVESASKVGTESVNGFSTDKYNVEFNTMSLGPMGAAMRLQGGLLNYKGVGWVERKSGALVKATVDLTAKGAKDKEPTTIQMRYDVKKASVAPIEAPTNVFAIPTPGS